MFDDALGTASSPHVLMAKRTNVSAGLLLFRRPNGELEVFLAYPGGPFWKTRDLGAWTVPKGLAEEDEDSLGAAPSASSRKRRASAPKDLSCR